MTQAAWTGWRDRRRPASMVAPTSLAPSEVSIVIPVRDNQAGIDRFLRVVDELQPAYRPGEIVIVDSASAQPIRLDRPPVDCRLLRSDRPGAARARNIGWRAASNLWILFCDSDCVLTDTSIAGYLPALDGAIAYAGMVRALTGGLLAHYYDEQKILIPPPTDSLRPAYLVTANALVWKASLTAVDGFDEAFPSAGGEDIDLALRLHDLGTLSFAPDSVVLHDFTDGIRGFVHRFVRYGRGNFLLESRHEGSHRPRRFAPALRSAPHWVLAHAQYAAMLVGYHAARVAARLGG